MLAALFPLGFLESNSPGVQSLYFNLTFVLSTDYLFLAISECYQVLELILVLLITERDVFANPDRSKLGRSSLASWDNLEWLPLRAAPVAVTWHAGHRCNSLEDLFSFRRAIPAGVTLLSTSSRPPPHFSTTLMYIYIFFFTITYRNSSWYNPLLVPVLQGIVRPHLFGQDIFVSTLSTGSLQLFLVMEPFLLAQPSQG